MHGPPGRASDRFLCPLARPPRLMSNPRREEEEVTSAEFARILTKQVKLVTCLDRTLDFPVEFPKVEIWVFRGCGSVRDTRIYCTERGPRAWVREATRPLSWTENRGGLLVSALCMEVTRAKKMLRPVSRPLHGGSGFDDAAVMFL